MSPRVAIVIPTRNRADLAVAAIESLLSVHDRRLARLVVSNNSSDPAQVRQLADHCAQRADDRLVHIRPPRALGMAEHWDWAIGQALDTGDCTHVGLHYDRRVSRPELAMVFDAAERRPDLPITYLLDIIHPAPTRFRVFPMPWTGGLYEIRSARALELAAAGRLTDLWQAFPVLVNCVTPRSVLERVRDRFGDYCNSTSPESCFGFRFCAVGDSYLHFDRALGIHYASARSNGMGYIKGDGSGAFADFISLLGDRPWLDAAPLPGLSLGQNSFYHEYELARRAAGNGRFPPIAMPAYLKDLARGLPWIADPARRAEAQALLVSHGWQDEAPGAWVAPPPGKLSERLREGLDLLRIDHFRASAEEATTIGFKDEAKALRWARMNTQPSEETSDFLAPLEPIRKE